MAAPTNTAHGSAKGVVKFSPVDYAVVSPLTNGTEGNVKKEKRLSWRFLLKHFPRWSMLFIAHLIHIGVNEGARSFTTQGRHKNL